MNDPLWQNALDTLRTPPFAERALPEYLRRCRWFGGKAHALRSVQVLDAVPLGVAATGGDAGRLAFLQVHYADLAPEIYLMPLQLPVVAGASETLLDSLDDESFRSALFEIILGEKRLQIGRAHV